MAENITMELIAAPAEKLRVGSRFASWFIRGVAGFLAVTAVLKLLSIVTELPLLRSPDPLLPFLTVRQSTLAAACLELGGAYWLFRRQRSSTAPWLILWLVAVFTTYRLGLHAVGFRGPCSCLGVLPFYFPLSRPWLDWVGPLALVGMGFGSICLLLARRQVRQAKRYPPEHSAARMAVSTLLLLSLFGHASFLVGADLPPFTAHATVIRNIYSPARPAPLYSITSSVRLYQSNGWWRIRAIQSIPTQFASVPGEQNVRDLMRIPDGRREFSTALPTPNPTKTRIAALAMPTPFPNPALNDLFGVWLTFTPNPPLPVIEPGRIRRLVSERVLDSPKNQGTFALGRLGPKSPFLRRLVITNDGTILLDSGEVKVAPFPFDRGWIEFEYTVLRTTNTLGRLMPAESRLRDYWFRNGGTNAADTYVTSEATVILNTVLPLSQDPPPPPEPLMIAMDHRPPSVPKDRNAQTISYVVTNDLWEPASSARIEQLLAIQGLLAQTRPPLLRVMMPGLLLVVLLLPFPLWWLTRRRSRRLRKQPSSNHAQNTSSHNNSRRS